MRSSFQLYSARKQGTLDATLSQLRQIGFVHVEGYAGLLDDVEGLQRALSTHGLDMPSCHIGLDVLESDPGRAVAIARQLGIRQVFAPYLEPEQRPATAAGWRELAGRLDTVAARLSRDGIGFGWHNHDFELVPTPEGAIPLCEILDNAPHIQWQGDLAWIQRAGTEPLDMLDRYADRLASIHVKDIAAPGDCLDEDGWADPGDGIMDWRRLLARVEQCTQAVLPVVEHDNPSDAGRFARRAFDFMQAADTAASVSPGARA